MGNLFGNCIKTNHKDDQPKSNNNGRGDPFSNPKKDRVYDQDKAILDVKARMRKIKVYVDKINIQIEQQAEKIKDLIKNKSKERALIALKHKKFLEKELDKASGAQQMLQ